ncbi:MAG: hypothetical protein AB9917_17625 [Negativicutes bacterium]
MAINSIVPVTQQGISNTGNNSRDLSDSGGGAENKSVAAIGEAAVYEKSANKTTGMKTYTKDAVALNEINRQVEMKMSSLRAIVENLAAVQIVKTGESKGLSYDQIMEKYDGKLKMFYQNLKVDEETRLNAQQDILKNGFWGVKQASERAIAFAKALSGGDPSKIALLKSSVEEGYAAAEKTWGGELPEICKQTKEATLKGLDVWAKEAGQTA